MDINWRPNVGSGEAWRKFVLFLTSNINPLSADAFLHRSVLLHVILIVCSIGINLDFIILRPEAPNINFIRQKYRCVTALY